MKNLASLIDTVVEIDESSLDPYQRAFYKAKTKQDADSYRLLARIVHAALPTGVHSGRGIEKLVRIYFGHGISFISVRADLRCTKDQVRAYQQAVRDSMNAVRNNLKISLEKMLATK